MYDLKVFVLFYAILLAFFSLIFAVIGVGNHRYGEFEKQLAEWKTWDVKERPFDKPNEEYDRVGMLLGYFFSTLRISTGDFDFNASTYLSTEENYVYWVIWLLTVYTTTIIFLNFIIAEVGDSYGKVKNNLDALLAKEKTALI